MNSKESLDEVSKNQRSDAGERRKKASRRRSEEGSWDMADSGAATPGNEEDKKDV
jgi:glycerol-3-phosphate O-acyltransferase/dihydroxyacetone phosphate acyltransferase